MQTDVRILEVRPYFQREMARTPMKFGGVVLDSAVYCHVRVLVENRQGRSAEGWGAIFLADQWAWPQIQAGHAVAEQLMQDLVVAWCRRVQEYSEFAHPIDLFWTIEPELMPLAEQVCRRRDVSESMPRMAALISASPVDAAVHDAFGNVNQIDAYDAYGPEHCGHDLSRWLGPDFHGKYISDYLKPLSPRIDAFHLVGGLDALTPDELGENRLDDGLPNSLTEWIRRERLHCLKIKLVGNDFDWDLNRLLSVVRIARQEHQQLQIPQMWLTVDSNEMCDTPDYMVELLQRFRDLDPAGFESLLYVEQPCERDLQRRRMDVRELASLKPVIADEALGSLEDLHLALELGYSGAALKSCKCQSEQLVIAALLTERQLPFSVQDLANPGIALLHSVGLAGRLHVIRGVESNSRQFFPNTSQPEMTIHPGVYHLMNGQIDTSTLRGSGLGLRWQEIGRQLPPPD